MLRVARMAAMVIFWGMVTSIFVSARASERLTLPDQESAFDNPLPPMPKPLLEKKGQKKIDKKSIENPESDDDKNNKNEAEKAAEHASEKLPTGEQETPQVDAQQKPAHDSGSVNAPVESHSAEEKSVQTPLQSGSLEGSQVILAQDKSTPTESRTGWYWFFAAISILLLAFFVMA